MNKHCYEAVFIANALMWFVQLSQNSQLHSTMRFPRYNERNLADKSPRPVAHDTSWLYISASVYTQYHKKHWASNKCRGLKIGVWHIVYVHVGLAPIANSVQYVVASLNASH